MKRFLILISPLILILPASADLQVTGTPGFTFSDTSAGRPTVANLNRALRFTYTVAGTIGGTNAGLSAKSVNGGHLADSVAGSNLTWNASSPRGLVIGVQGVDTNNVSTNAFAGSLQGGAGVPVTNRTDNSSIIVNANRQLTIATNAAVETVLTNTDFALIFSTRTNGPGGGTNKVFELTTMTTLFNFVSNAIIGRTLFTSAETSLAAGKIIDAAHGFSNTPTQLRAVLVCQTVSSLGYSLGDEVNIETAETGGGVQAFSVGVNSTNVWFNCTDTTPEIPNKTNSTASRSSITASHWKAKVYTRP